MPIINVHDSVVTVSERNYFVNDIKLVITPEDDSMVNLGVPGKEFKYIKIAPMAFVSLHGKAKPVEDRAKPCNIVIELDEDLSRCGILMNPYHLDNDVYEFTLYVFNASKLPVGIKEGATIARMIIS